MSEDSVAATNSSDKLAPPPSPAKPVVRVTPFGKNAVAVLESDVAGLSEDELEDLPVLIDQPVVQPPPASNKRGPRGPYKPRKKQNTGNGLAPVYNITINIHGDPKPEVMKSALEKIEQTIKSITS